MAGSGFHYTCTRAHTHFCVYIQHIEGRKKGKNENWQVHQSDYSSANSTPHITKLHTDVQTSWGPRRRHPALSIAGVDIMIGRKNVWKRKWNQPSSKQINIPIRMWTQQKHTCRREIFLHHENFPLFHVNNRFPSAPQNKWLYSNAIYLNSEAK